MAANPISWTNPTAKSHRRRWLPQMRHRFPHIRPETLMVIATCFSAIAAAGSVWAALRQEDATYESQLYNKEAEIVAQLYPRLTTLQHQLSTYDNLPPLPHVISALKEEIESVESLLESVTSSLEPISSARPVSILQSLKSQMDGLEITGLDDDGHRRVWYERDYPQFRSTLDAWKRCTSLTLGKGRPLDDAVCS